VAAENAHRKATAIAAQAPGHIVLGVDTVVALGAQLYGKPQDRGQARSTLRALNGRRHRVLGGVCLISEKRVQTMVVSTQVEFRRLDEPAIERYLDSGEWVGRAGGYAIQGRGALLVRALEGDYLNVVGLPVAAITELAPGLFD
jgi:septum formation protein